MQSYPARLRPAATLAAVVLGFAIGSPGPAVAGQDPTLETVLERAARYVEQYQRDLSSVIAEEHYLQVADGTKNRRTVSDILVFSQPGAQEQWLAFRDVIEVDGRLVEDRLQRLEELFLQSPRVTGALRRQLIAESARYNIGGITRNMNVPTMALQLVAASDQPRVEFEKNGEDRIDGIDTWEIEFEEIGPPAMIKDSQAGDLFGGGKLWIEPTTGRVLRTEFRAEDDLEAQGAELEIEMKVEYQHDERLDILVPIKMTEKYLVRLNPISHSLLARRSIEVNCEAIYSNFRRFEVQVDFVTSSVP